MNASSKSVVVIDADEQFSGFLAHYLATRGYAVPRSLIFFLMVSADIGR